MKRFGESELRRAGRITHTRKFYPEFAQVHHILFIVEEESFKGRTIPPKPVIAPQLNRHPAVGIGRGASDSQKSLHGF